jgi:hypothetical protein
MARIRLAVPESGAGANARRRNDEHKFPISRCGI